MSDGSVDEELPAVAKIKIWEPSGLIEEAVVHDQGMFQTEEWDRENPGELKKHDAVLAKDIIRFLRGLQHNDGTSNYGDAALEDAAKKIEKQITDKERKTETGGGSSE